MQGTWVQFPASLWMLTTTCIFNSGTTNAFFWPLRTPPHIWYTQTHGSTHSYINTILSVFYWYIITLKYLSRCISFVKFLDFGFFFKIYFCYFIYLPVLECTWVYAPNMARGFRYNFVVGIIYDCLAMICVCWEPNSDPLNKLCMYFTIPPSPVLAFDDTCKLPSFADTVFQCLASPGHGLS